jgi:dienelactone hydrolase
MRTLLITVRRSGTCCLVLVVIAIRGQLFAQKHDSIYKQNIDIGVLDTWPYVRAAQISPFGRYIAYDIDNQPKGSHTLAIIDSSGRWSREYPGGRHFYFSLNERLVIFHEGDTIHLLTLGRSGLDEIIRVTSYTEPIDRRGEWLAYSAVGDSGVVTLLDLLNGKTQKMGKASEYSFDDQGRTLLLKDTSGGDSEQVVDIRKVDLENMRSSQVWRGEPGDDAMNFTFDDGGGRLAFIVTEKRKGRILHSLWRFQPGDAEAEMLIRDDDKRVDPGFQIDGQPEFTGNGSWILFSLEVSAPTAPVVAKGAVKVEVWSYNDKILMPEQMAFPTENTTAAIGVNGDHFYQFENAYPMIVTRQLSGNAIVIGYGGNVTGSAQHYYLFNLADGSSKLLGHRGTSLTNFCLSPDGRWCIYFDPALNNYFSFDLLSGKIRNITGLIPASIVRDYPAGVESQPVSYIAGWIREHPEVLVYDNFDLWMVSLDNGHPAVNVTGGYGRTHHVKLRIVYLGGQAQRGVFDFGDMQQSVFYVGDTLLLTGFNIQNKDNGFYRKVLGSKGKVEELIMGPYTYYRTPSQKPHEYAFDDGMQPLKAAFADCWLIKRESEKEAPNYFITNDFRHYRQLSDLKPQLKYNWLTTQLINWRQLDGTVSQGILYKPENFDPGKRYPLIFNYYQQLSHRLHEFPMPELTEENINIPWFVSQGYLVFTPDIHYKTASESGKTIGEWTYNSVVSAARYLAKLPYVDSRRMGIDGHSFGGGETNYLVAHTHIFAAAAEAAGNSDPISAYLTLIPLVGAIEFKQKQTNFEQYDERMGATPWQRPDLYRKESVVLDADRVTTPLLIMHNKRDGNIQWRQGVELYMALRRLGKKVWMLQYDDDGHVVRGKDALDYTIRLTQFFDYYLKGELPPRWMTEGIPARLKGIDAGYELDHSGRIP